MLVLAGIYAAMNILSFVAFQGIGADDLSMYVCKLMIGAVRPSILFAYHFALQMHPLT
jgi:hypothetical protein